MNKDGMLATVHDENTMANEFNPKIISLTKTVARLQLAIVLNGDDMNQFFPKKISY